MTVHEHDVVSPAALLCKTCLMNCFRVPKGPVDSNGASADKVSDPVATPVSGARVSMTPRGTSSHGPAVASPGLATARPARNSGSGGGSQVMSTLLAELQQTVQGLKEQVRLAVLEIGGVAVPMSRIAVLVVG
jgi:hypothetical protein